MRSGILWGLASPIYVLTMGMFFVKWVWYIHKPNNIQGGKE